jgi:hypothetical protein
MKLTAIVCDEHNKWKAFEQFYDIRHYKPSGTQLCLAFNEDGSGCANQATTIVVIEV